MTIIDYFSSLTASFTIVALQLGKILALCGIIWCCIQMVFGTMESRKFITGTVTKWFLFLICLAFFPSFSRGLRYFAIELGTTVSGRSAQSVQDALGGFYQDLKKLADADDKDLQNIKNKIDELSQAKLKLIEAEEKYYEESKTNALKMVTFFPTELDAQILVLNEQISDYEAEKLKLEKRKDNTNLKGYRKTMNAIRSVLIIDDTNTVPKYSMNLTIKDSAGNDTGYLSPNALMRISLLAAQIMWETEWQDDFMYTWAENSGKTDKNGNIKTDKNGEVKKKITKFPVSHLFNVILCFICMLMLLVITCVELIQYIMCIVEYSICSSYCIVLIPCLLFDGMKDMAAKILPSLLAQAVKLSMIILCMFFCTYMYLDIAVYVAGGNGFSVTTFCYVAFVILLTFALCSNAPKLAVTLLTGQPQMSMGEFVQAAGAVAGGAHLAGKITQRTVEGGRTAIGKTAQATANRLGDIAAMAGGANAASSAAKAEGKGRFGTGIAGMSGAIAALNNRTGNRIKGKLQNMATYTGKHGGSGGYGGSTGGIGSSRFISDDAKAERERNTHETSNAHSMNYLGASNKNGTKMILGEYMRDQFQGGQNIGANNYTRHMKNAVNKNSRVTFGRSQGMTNFGDKDNPDIAQKANLKTKATDNTKEG